MRRTLVAGNWKMNGSLSSIRALMAGIRDGLSSVEDRDVLVFPPFPYLGLTVELAAGTGVAVGAQDLSAHQSGAYTGEVSGAMIRDCGASHVLAGHSERRQYHAEGDDLVAEKAAAALAQGLIPVVCVGETLAEREADETEAVVGRQLAAVLERLGVAAFAEAIVAYEPVWAIGTGRTASPEQAQAAHAFIRSQVAALDDTIGGRLRILYGGSVKASNASELFAMADIDGGLIGGASLSHEEFMDICRA